MILKNMTIQNLGYITHFSYEFKEGLNVVRDCRRDELFFALRTILNHKTPPPSSISIGVDTKIEAEILLAEEEYRVVASPDKQNESFVLSCFNTYGADVTSEYLYLTKHSYEQDQADIFSGDEEVSYRFMKYANEDLYYLKGELAKSTDGLSNIKAFRRYLRIFLDNFEPEPLRQGRKYEFFLQKSGQYAVRYKDTGAITDLLSASEKMIFKYLCFLRTAEFWHGFEGIRNLHGIKKPLLIGGFLEKLDESIDVRELLYRTEKLKRQTILITNITPRH